MSSSQTSELSKSKFDENFESKKKKLRPYPEEEGQHKSASHSKKLKGTASKTLSKSKLTSQKKSEVTFSDAVEEIKDGEVTSQVNKENSDPVLTPFKNGSPSKESLKSCKLHVKTPFSKLKENDDSQVINSSKSKAGQPNFDGEIMNQSASKHSKNVTPQKSAQKSVTKLTETINKSAQRSKSPLTKIREEKVESENGKSEESANREIKTEEVPQENAPSDENSCPNTNEDCPEVTEPTDEKTTPTLEPVITSSEIEN